MDVLRNVFSYWVEVHMHFWMFFLNIGCGSVPEIFVCVLCWWFVMLVLGDVLLGCW